MQKQVIHVLNSLLTNDLDYCNNQLVCLQNCFCLKLEPYVDKICLKTSCSRSLT